MPSVRTDLDWDDLRERDPDECVACAGLGGIERARFDGDPDPQWRNCGHCKGTGRKAVSKGIPAQPEKE